MESFWKNQISRYVLASVSLLATLCVLYIDFFILKRPFFYESRPGFSELFLIRMDLTAMASFSLVAAVFLSSGKADNKTEVLDWMPRVRKRATVWTVMAVSCLITAVFIYNPDLYSRLRREDGVVEYLSAIFAVMASMAVFVAAWNFFRSKTQNNITLTCIVLLGVIFFLIGMEEISWFQRILDIGSPDIFSTNLQREMNLHNFATNEVENAYYFGAFLMFVLIPYIHLKTNLFYKFKSLELLIPTPYIIFVGAITTAYNFDMWNILLTQYAFFITVAVMASLTWQLRNSPYKLLPLMLLFLVVITQGLYLKYGQNFELDWHVTEYKELFIPFTFFIYAMELNEKVRQL